MLNLTLPRVDHRALAAARDDQCLDLLQHLRGRPPGLLLQNLPFIVVHGDPARLLDESPQLLAAEHRQTLSRVEHEPDLGGGKLRRVLHHSIAAVRRDDTDRHGAGVLHAIQVRAAHRPGMKRPDLVVVEVGRHETLRGVLAVDHLDVIGGNARLAHPLGIRRKIPSDRSHRIARVAQQPQVVGDVAGAPAEFPPQLRHQERDVQHVDLVGQDVLLEASLEHHDGVVGDRAADQGFH